MPRWLQVLLVTAILLPPVASLLFVAPRALHAQEPAEESSTPATAEETEEPAPAPVPGDVAPPPQPATAAGSAAPGVSAAATPEAEPTSADANLRRVYVIPITDAIGSPNRFILRRGIKEAVTNDIDTLVLDIDTPGGQLGQTLEIMEMLDRFDGVTVAYVNDEAISAGAYISAATDEIWFAPSGIIGAAAVVTGTGEDVAETMKQKIDSYLRARMRSLTDEHRYRAQVIRAMMDADYVLEIDGEVIKEEGELLSLTATEAIEPYGDPPEPLFGRGIADDVDDLLTQRYGAGNYEVREFRITWSEELAKWFQTIAPILAGLGLLLLIVEFKTPGFGVLGLSGIALLITVFLSNYVAGLAGHEGALVFALGILLLAVEIFLLPGTVFIGLLGVIAILGGLVWSLADIWPKPDGGWEITTAALAPAMIDVGIALAVLVVGLVLVWRLLPHTPLWNQLVLSSTIATPDATVAGGSEAVTAGAGLPDVGAQGRAITSLHPSGEIDIDGRRFQAIVEVGSIDRGEPVVVTGYRQYAVLVDRARG